MFRRCSLRVEKEKDEACGTSMCRCDTSACVDLLVSHMEYSLERVQILIWAQTNTLREICKNSPWAWWLFRFRSKLTLVTSRLTMFRFCVLTTQSFLWPGADLTGSRQVVLPAQHAASSVEWAYHFHAGMFDRLRHGQMRAPGDHQRPSNCSALTSCPLHVHAHIRGISACSSFHLRLKTHPLY